MHSAKDHSPPLVWRAAALADLAAISRIEHQVHTLLPERPAVIAEKIRLFGQGCMVLTRGPEILGYGLSHPWRLDSIPALDSFMEKLPEAPECLFIHDVALLPEGRRKGACHAYVDRIAQLAQNLGLTKLALVSVYGTYPLWQSCGFRITPLRAAPEKLDAYGDSARYMVADLRASGTTGE